METQSISNPVARSPGRRGRGFRTEPTRYSTMDVTVIGPVLCEIGKTHSCAAPELRKKINKIMKIRRQIINSGFA